MPKTPSRFPVPMNAARAAVAALGLLGGTPLLSSATLRLGPGPGSGFDLPVSGLIGGAGAAHASRHDLLALPTANVDVSGLFGTSVRTAQVVYLEDLVGALPADPAADLLLATCADGYLSVYPFAFIHRYHPFLVLQLDGTGPEHWPPPGLQYNPGPYAISVSEKVAPGVASVRDIAHKEPWSVVSLRVTSVAASFGAFYRGRWAAASGAVRSGREIWINSCASCHPGPEGVAGGIKSGMPFAVLVAIAGGDRKFFMQYVRDPTSLVPTAKMEPHPHYSDAELADLISFLTVPPGG